MGIENAAMAATVRDGMGASPCPHGRSRWLALAAILALALALRIAAGILLPDQHFSDAADYRRAAHLLWTTGELGDPLVMPLYPALVGLVGAGWGQLALDIALSTFMVWLVYRLTCAMFADRAAALVAALAAAVYPYFIFYAVVGLTETLFIVLLLAAFVCWYGGRFGPAALFMVLGILTRPTLDLLSPLLVVCFALAVFRFAPGRAVRQLAAYAAIYCVLMTPWWLHNYHAYDRFVRLDLGSGLLFYAGNNPANTSGGSLVTDGDRSPFKRIADPVARDRALWNAGVAFIKKHPRRAVALAGLKFMRFWRPWPYAEEYATRLYVVLSLVSFVPVLAFTLVYLAGWGWREAARIAPILMLIAYLTAVHVVFAASARYRLPLEPFLIVFAAAAVARLARAAPVIAAMGR